MFKCEKCIQLEKEITYLREQNAKLLDRVLALADAKAYGAVNASVVESEEYFGTKDDVITYDEYGQKMIYKS